MDPTWPYALVGVAVCAVAVARRERLGRGKAAAILVTVGAVMLASEDGALSLWLPLVPPGVDPDGLAGVANPHARAHMLGAGAWTLLAAGLVVALAWGPMRRGERWGWRCVAAALLVAGAVDVAAYGALYAHGLDAPLPGARGGFGWPPVAVALAAWTAGVVLGRPRLRYPSSHSA
ncbi:MAG TPA: hypothetical protein VHH36_03435, partial [Candidatus Thermoplasmatota archaeon]|nr:hypothetical protein [Candidatus Thermoplasmatota archaeon]